MTGDLKLEPAQYHRRQPTPPMCQGNTTWSTEEVALAQAKVWVNSAYHMVAYYCERCLGWHLRSGEKR